jgi:hypothetical protein
VDVRLSDGTLIRNIPEGTTQKQVLDRLARNGFDVSELQRQSAIPIGEAGFGQAAKEVAGETGGAGRFLQGMGETFDRYAYGAKGLFTDLSDEEKRRLAQNKQLAEYGGAAGTVGQIAGDVAITAPAFAAGGALLGPAARAATMTPAATAALQAGQRLPFATRAAQTGLELGGYTGGGAAAGALSSPEDRLGGATAGGIGGAAGYAGGRVLQRTLGGALPAGEEARALMREGVRVPVWQAGEAGTLTGGATRRIGELFRRLPLAGAALRSQEARALEDWNRKILIDAATPPRPITNEAGSILRWERQPIKEVSDNTVNLLKERFHDAYDAIYRHRRVPLDELYVNETDTLIGATQRYAPHLAGEVQGTLNRIADTLARGTETTTTRSAILDAAGRPVTITTPGHAAVSANAIKDAINAADDAVTNAYRQGRGDLAEVLEGFRDSLHELRLRSLPPDVARSLADVNAAYTRFKPLERAHASLGAQKAGMVTPRQVLAAQKAGDRSAGKAAFAGKNLPGQRETLGAERVLSNVLPDVGPGTADALAFASYFASAAIGLADLGATAMLGTAPGQKLLAGAYPWQAIARTPAARQAITAAGASAGVAEERKRRELLRRVQMRAAELE